MTETELFSLVGFIILIIGAISGAWWRVESKVKEAKESAYHKSDLATARADTAIATASLAREELLSYKTHVAETYISKAGHARRRTRSWPRSTASRQRWMAQTSASIGCSTIGRKRRNAP